MKKISKKLFFAGLLFVLAPSLALAQWDVTNVGTQSQLPDGNIFNILMLIMEWLLLVIGMVAIIGFCISGIMYLTAAGNEEQIKKAKGAMVYSIIGVIVALSGYVIIKAVDIMLRGGTAVF